jgi:hypothetical protein
MTTNIGFPTRSRIYGVRFRNHNRESLMKEKCEIPLRGSRFEASTPPGSKGGGWSGILGRDKGLGEEECGNMVG